VANLPAGWGLPKDPQIRRRQRAALRRGGKLRRTKRLRKKFEKGFGEWFHWHVKGGGFLP
jgi:hypothetical protein